MKNEQDFYFAIEQSGFTICYNSDPYKLTESELLDLIRICVVERRAVTIGKKIINIYRDVFSNDIEKCDERLKQIGVNNKNEKPKKTNRIKER